MKYIKFKALINGEIRGDSGHSFAVFVVVVLCWSGFHDSLMFSLRFTCFHLFSCTFMHFLYVFTSFHML